MKIHYFMDWFYNGLPKKLSVLLAADIVCRKSLVMISANPLSTNMSVGITERSWLDQADITFDEYRLIDYSMQKETAQKVVENASVIFLLGGNPSEQKALLIEYALPSLIKASNAIVLGTSAGAMNMSSKWVYDYKVEQGSLNAS